MRVELAHRPASYVALGVITAVACEDEVHEDTSDELAIHAAKDFLGVDISCASCHDGGHLEKINLYLEPAEARGDLEERRLRQDERLRRTEVSTAQDEYSIDDNGPGDDRSQRHPRAAAGSRDSWIPSTCFTGASRSRKHPRPGIRADADVGSTFARATVNLLWAEMFGVGIVEPVFSFDLARLDPKNPPPAPGSATLASGTARSARPALSRQQLQHPIGVEADRKSSAYQLSSQFPASGRKATRRISRASSCAA